MQRYLTNLAVSLSILLNATIDLSLFRGSFGKRYEMLSSRAYRCEWWFAVSIIDWWFELAFDENDHCMLCFEQQTRDGIYRL